MRNSEKTVIVDALKDRQSLSVLLERIFLSKGSYYYQKFSLQQEDKYYDIRKKITKLFFENIRCYGYRRIYGLLRQRGTVLSEKIVRRIMQEEGLVVKSKRHRTYSNYQGEISPCGTECAKKGLPGRPAKQEMTHGHHRICHSCG